MDDELRREIRAALARRQEGIGSIGDARSRLLRQALEEARRPRLVIGLAGAIGTVAVGAAIAIGVLLTHGQARQTPALPTTIEQALTSGPAAVIPALPERAFVWLTGYVTTPPASANQGGQITGVTPPATANQGGQITGVTVAVIDWSGRVRYQFKLPNSRPGLPNEIQSISPDGTRALLADGTVIDQTGAVIRRLPALQGQGMPGTNTTHWMADDQHICASFSNEPVANYPALHPKGAPNATPTPAQPYTLPGADHSVTLKIFGLDGSVRTVATVGGGSLGIPSGSFGDSTSVLSCNPTNDLAVVARYHDADNGEGQTSTNMTVSLWAIKLSNGAVLLHTPETRMALGRAFFYGSQDGKLAVEYLWNSKVWGAETDVVLRMPSGAQVPVLDAEPIPDTTGLSADGTRILRRLVDEAHQHTILELIDASNGRIIRRVVLPGVLGATAVAMPGGPSFMVEVQGYFALVDGNGGISLLHPDVNSGSASAPGVGLPPTAVQN